MKICPTLLKATRGQKFINKFLGMIGFDEENHLVYACKVFRNLLKLPKKD